MSTRVVFGPPGTGKTTHLVDVVDEEVNRGVRPEEIAFFSFSRAAVNEARGRVMARFDLGEEHLPWFRTMHSCGFRLHGMSRDDVMTERDYVELGERCGLPVTGSYDEDTTFVTSWHTPGDFCLRVYQVARSRLWTYEQAWRLVWEPESSVRSFDTFMSFLEELRAYRTEKNKCDFTQMLDAVPGCPRWKTVLVDEAQDLTPQQWQFLENLLVKSRPERVVVAGDDDQAIYEWAGASVEHFLMHRGERTVLSRSYRLPRRHYTLAHQALRQLRLRVAKTWEPRASDGVLEFVYSAQLNHDVGLLDGEWLLLGRSRHQVAALVKTCFAAGVVFHHQGRWSNQAPAVRAAVAYEALRQGRPVPLARARQVASFVTGADLGGSTGPSVTWENFHWHLSRSHDWMTALDLLPENQREYIRLLRRNHEQLTSPGRVRVSTVHAAKGLEADNVLLSNQLVSARAIVGDEESRVWYVGATRARERLVLWTPTSRQYYQENSAHGEVEEGRSRRQGEEDPGVERQEG